MKHLQIWLIYCILILLQINCRNFSHPSSGLQNKEDSIIALSADSLAHEDPWIKFSYTERQGKHLFELYCVVCHGKNGEGDGFNAYNLNPRPHSFADTTYMKALSRETLTEIISYGGKSLNKSIMMPGYVYTLNKNQISNLVAFIGTFTHSGSSLK
jgi:cytochrome c oxidase cbb3-type subunit III